LSYHKDWEKARRQALALINALGENLNLFICFYFCDNQTGDKSVAPYEWFKALVGSQ
jgi:hypothetical protein